MPIHGACPSVRSAHLMVVTEKGCLILFTLVWQHVHLGVEVLPSSRYKHICSDRTIRKCRIADKQEPLWWHVTSAYYMVRCGPMQELTFIRMAQARPEVSCKSDVIC